MRGGLVVGPGMIYNFVFGNPELPLPCCFPRRRGAGNASPAKSALYCFSVARCGMLKTRAPQRS